MELHQLLNQRFDCSCGRQHALSTRHFIYEAGAVGKAGSILSDLEAHRVAVVADSRTWKACGACVFDTLREQKFDIVEIIVPDGAHGGPVCDDVTSAALRERLGQAKPDAIVAVGSGVINDLCKWTSFELDVPYMVVATAASMNGYAAANVAARIAGVKVLVEAKAPVAVLAEPKVIEQAPAEMTAAGFGDTIAKYQSNTDWALNHLLFAEYYCEFCAGILGDLEHLYLDRPEDIRSGSDTAIGGLFAALFWTGAAMTLVGTSAPASGGEHLLSHTLDMVSDMRNERHDLHGRQVGLGTIFSAALYEQILALETPLLTTLPAHVDRDFWTSAPVFEAVKRQYEAKEPDVEMARLRIGDAALWERLRTRLAPLTKDPATVKDWLVRAGAASTARDIGISRDALLSTVPHMHEIRKRFTVVDLAWLVGILPDAAEEIVDRWLID